jgi:hypothetical protein
VHVIAIRNNVHLPPDPQKMSVGGDGGDASDRNGMRLKDPRTATEDAGHGEDA